MELGVIRGRWANIGGVICRDGGVVTGLYTGVLGAALVALSLSEFSVSCLCLFRRLRLMKLIDLKGG